MATIDTMLDGDTLDLQGTGFDTVDELIECNGEYSLLNYFTYDISVVSDLDGRYNSIVTVPVMASENAGGILWVLLTSGFFHRIQIGANSYSVDDNNDLHSGFIHLKFTEATMCYQGQLA